MINVLFDTRAPCLSNFALDENTPSFGGGGGLEWVAQATGGTAFTPSTRETDTPTTTTTSDLLAAAISGNPLPKTMLKSSTVPTTSGSPDASDWLTTAALGSSINKVGNAEAMTNEPTEQRPRKQNPTSKALPGAWLTAGGKLGVSTRQDSDEDGETRGSVKHSIAALSKGRSAGARGNKRDGGARSTASASGGWLTGAVTSGKLGIPGGDNGDSSSEDGVEGGRFKDRWRATETATVGTQWEENAGESVGSRSRLPPWAKAYHAPSEEATAVEDVVTADTAKKQVKGEHCSVIYSQSHI